MFCTGILWASAHLAFGFDLVFGLPSGDKVLGFQSSLDRSGPFISSPILDKIKPGIAKGNDPVF